MAKVRKRRVRWNVSNGSEPVTYKLYWAVGGGVSYSSENSEVGSVTEIVLPDDAPSFPLVDGEIELGVTAVNEIGNESDMAKFSVPFEFAVPQAPLDIVVETIQDFHVSERKDDQPGGHNTE
jgi:hypothetical protein